MSLSALDKIKELKEKTAKDIAALTAEGVSELTKKISETKTILADYQRQYEELTGKPATGAKVARVRLSAEESAALVVKVEGIIKGAHNGISMGDIVETADASISAVRKAVKSAKGIKTAGSKATTMYFAK